MALPRPSFYIVRIRRTAVPVDGLDLSGWGAPRAFSQEG